MIKIYKILFRRSGNMIIIRDIIFIILLGFLAQCLPQLEITINNLKTINIKLYVIIRIILVIVFIITLIRFAISGTYNSILDATVNFLHIRFSEI